jgi:beta-glucanase (GH16 family)
MSKINQIVSGVLGSLLAGIGVCAPAWAGSFSSTPVWSDHFDAGTNKWNLHNGPFGASSNTTFTPANAWISNEAGNNYLNLLVSQSGDRTCSSGGIDTVFTNAQAYGKWEVRAKMAPGFGIVSYIGLFPRNPNLWPPELDFAEVIGREPMNLFLTQHYTRANQLDSLAYNPGSTDWTQGFHTYRVEWIPGKITYYVDNLKIAEQTDKMKTTRMKLAIGTGCGDPDSWIDSPFSAVNKNQPFPLPSVMQVDWVKIYRYLP